jgi:cupin fold WbuC family metalloprotein
MTKFETNQLMIETTPGVFHANAWGQRLQENLIEELIRHAQLNPNRKARLCLHPTSDELLQVTYLAFSKPYLDKIHMHPHRPEIVIPVHGLAVHNVFDEHGKVLRSQLLSGRNPVANSTQTKEWHAIELQTENFVMIEIGTGPFLPTSTIYLGDSSN